MPEPQRRFVRKPVETAKAKPPPKDTRKPQRPIQGPAKGKRMPKKHKEIIPRLPPGTTKHVLWDGKCWRGTMVVPEAMKTDGVVSGAMQFEFVGIDGGDEAHCYHGLDKEYRKWLAQQPKEQAP